MTSHLTKRLRWYWQMEAWNIVIVPGSALIIVLSFGGKINFALALSLAACALILVIGTLYWRAVLRRIEGNKDLFSAWLPRLASAKQPSFALVLISLAVSVVGIIRHASPENIGAIIMSALAGLEYLNYYVVQLQHFDNPADFNRLKTGKGFQKPHLQRDIAAWRRASSARNE